MATIWRISAIQFSDSTMISGVVLNSTSVKKVKITNYLKNALKIIQSYFKKVYANQEIFVTANNQTLKTNTDAFGGFSVQFNFIIEDEVIVKLPGNETPLDFHQTYPVLFKDSPSKLNVISDIDDSIMVSYTKTNFKRFFTTLFKVAEKRDVVSYSQELFEFLKTKNARFFYVSKSENNLFSLIATFISHNKLPIGPLLLTPYLSASQLLFNKKERDFKLNRIKYIVENSNDENFILLGDDTQKDMEIYATIARNYPSQIVTVYIRKTKQTSTKLQLEYWESLKDTGVEAYYFGHNETFKKH